MLVDRETECARLDLLLARARSGCGAALVVHGPPGAGKSALLDYARSAATDVTVLRSTGVPAEQGLPFAGLHGLLRPVIHRLEHLPGPQRDALGAALGLAEGVGVDRFMVAAAVLTVLADTAADGGVLCLVDDAHWVDRASLDTLLFAVRRLDVDPVAMVFATRTDEDPELIGSGLPTLPIGALGPAAVAALLHGRTGVAVAPGVAGALAAATEGNPLAVTELAGTLTDDQLRGRAPLPDPLPISAGLEQAFLTRVAALPEQARTLLLVAAAEGTGDLGAVLDGTVRLVGGAGSLDTVEAAGLLRISEGRLEFRHPLVRSAVYGAATASRRRQVHRVLADVLRDAATSDRRAWHLAAATLGVDDSVADDLDASARRARLRGGHAAAAVLLHRSAQLTTDGVGRAGRLVDSAENCWSAGQPEAAYARLAEAERLVTEPALQDRVALLRGRLELRRGVATQAYRVLFDRAGSAAVRAPGMALRMLAEAADAASMIGDMAGLSAVGERARDVAPSGDAGAEFWRDLIIGVADMVQGRHEAGAARLTAAIAARDSLTDPFQFAQAGTAALYLGDLGTAWEAMEDAVRVARAGGLTGDLPYVLVSLAALEQGRGRYATAQAISEEGLRLAEETGQDSARCLHLSTLAIGAAIQGDEVACRRWAEQASALAQPRALGLPAGRAGLALAMLDLGAGRYGQAVARFAELADAPAGAGHPGVVLVVLPDWIEAAVRADDLPTARRVLKMLESLTANADGSAQATVPCCRALLAGDDQAGALFEESLAGHAAAGTPLPGLARAHLLYGEWLRRNRQRSRSREHLRTAMEMFERLGARPYAARARTELRASGESVQRRDGAESLTPQELRIAQSVAQGRSTRDIAATLFLSPRTVEYHLYKLFPKLGVTTRAQLIRVVAERPELVDGAA